MEQARIAERYRLIEEVGQGGMAVVYRAQDETLKREVAIKILHQHLAGEPDSKARLEREAQAVAKLRHENILEIFDYSGTGSETSFIVTEFIDGETLKQFLAKHQPRFAEVAALIAVEVCRALGHAHGLGVIHRDVKPENVMIRKDGLLKLMDFGIAQVLDFQRMTVTGQLLGSPAYMAPEIIEGKPLDFRTDVFSVGIMLYLLATGQLPFSGKNPHEVLRRIAEGKFADPRTIAPGVDQRLARIISRALARLPDDRYPDVAPMADDLLAYLADGGLTDVRAELRAFFADPPSYERDLQPRLAAALSASAATQLRERRLARAMELWNRVLVFDPQNAEVSAALARLEGRRRLQRVSMGLALVAAVGVVSWATARRVQSRRRIAAAAVERATPPAAARPTPAPPRPAQTPTAVSVVEAPPARHVTPHPVRARPEGHVAPAPAPAARTFTLGPTPQNVDVYLDGQRQFAYDPAHTSITIPWNADHVLELRSPTGCCFVERVDIGPDHPLPPDAIIARRLKWRPARVVVTTEPPAAGARVLVRDPNRKVAAAASRPGQEIDVPFFTDDEASKEVEVSVDAGDSFVTDKIRVRAGQKLSHVVKLRPGAN